jgi:hypothetical protein
MKKIVIPICMVFVVATTFAQSNFGGSYKLSSMEHLTGPEYGNALPESYTIVQSADSLITTTPNGRYAYAMNGGLTTFVSPTSNRKSLRSLAWSSDKTYLILTNVIFMEGDPNTVDLTRVQTWKLSSDGKQLLVALKSVETKSEDWSVKGVYTKQ